MFVIQFFQKLFYFVARGLKIDFQQKKVSLGKLLVEAKTVKVVKKDTFVPSYAGNFAYSYTNISQLKYG